MAQRQSDQSEDQLDRLFVTYREACGCPDASPEFMPNLWGKIEARQNSSVFMFWLAKRLVTAAAAVCVLMGGLLVFSWRVGAQYYPYTYVDILAADQASESEGLLQAVFADPVTDAASEKDAL